MRKYTTLGCLLASLLTLRLALLPPMSNHMKECLLLTEAEKIALETQGYTIHSGPHDTLEECEAVCQETGTGTAITTGTGTGTVSTGTGTGGDVTPGPTCPSGAPISSGVTYGPFTLTTGNQHWFDVVVPAGIYHVTVNVTAITGGNAEVRIAENCTGLSFTTVTGTGIFCTSGVIVGVSGSSQAAMVLDGASSVTYTITFVAGAC